MRIALINGSPKKKESVSGFLLEELKGKFSGEAEVLEIGLHDAEVSEEVFEKLAGAEAWVFACPLYVDGLPGHLLSCLSQLEKRPVQGTKPLIYGVVNCGFYEGIQTETALALLQNWSARAGYSWAGGTGVGGGGAILMVPEGPRAPIDGALEEMAEKILRRKTQENRFVTVAFPRFLYQISGQIGWRKMIKANGGRARDLDAAPGQERTRG